jgi:hypothetical protein
MRPSRRLPKLSRTALHRLDHLQRRVSRLPAATDNSFEPEIEFVVIQLANLWSNFVRCYYLSSVFGARWGRRRHVHTSVSYRTINDAIGGAITTFRPRALPQASGQWRRRDEPAWHDNSTLLTLAQVGSWSTLPTIEAAFSIQGVRSILDLPVVRNFFAHRNFRSWVAARSLAIQYGIPQPHRISALVISVPLTGNDLLINQWLEELQLIIRWLCE